MSDIFIAETNGKSFRVFNLPDEPLTDEPVTDVDMIFDVEAKGEEMQLARSQAWSCGSLWFFVVFSTSIVLINVETGRGVLCKKKSYKFIEAYCDAPVNFDRKRKAGSR